MVTSHPERQKERFRSNWPLAECSHGRGGAAQLPPGPECCFQPGNGLAQQVFAARAEPSANGAGGTLYFVYRQDSCGLGKIYRLRGIFR
jgi:hypothetical protein